MGQAIRGIKRGEGGKEPAAHGVVMGEINQYMKNGEADPAVGANWGSLMSPELGKCGQCEGGPGQPPDDGSSGRKTGTDQS